MLVATTPAEALNEAAVPACIALEIICVMEVARMALVSLVQPFVSVPVLLSSWFLRLVPMCPICLARVTCREIWSLAPCFTSFV